MQAKRSLLRTYLKTGNTGTLDDWSLIGDGFTTNTISYEPDSDDLQYINQDTATTALKRYKPTMSLEGVIEMTESGSGIKNYELNKVFNYINELRRSRSISNESELLIVELYTGEFDTNNNVFLHCKSQKQKVNIQVEEFGGDAGETISYSATVNFSGDATESNVVYGVQNTSEGELIASTDIFNVSYPSSAEIDYIDKPLYAWKNKPLKVVVKAQTGKTLPNDITVKNGSSTLASGTDYTWEKATGTVTILAGKITGNVEITIIAT